MAHWQAILACYNKSTNKNNKNQTAKMFLLATQFVFLLARFGPGITAGRRSTRVALPTLGRTDQPWLQKDYRSSCCSTEREHFSSRRSLLGSDSSASVASDEAVSKAKAESKTRKGGSQGQYTEKLNSYIINLFFEQIISDIMFEISCASLPSGHLEVD